MYTRLKFNLTNSAIRHETLQGRAYLVAPMVMITEGVHNGSGGPLLYKEAEIKKAVPAWNMKPIVVYHPQLNGQGISACDPTVLEKQQVGMVMNTKCVKGKLRAEAWIDEALATKIDNRVIEALEENKVMEVSTGLFTDNTGTAGKWGAEDYTAEATNHQPDHLALLPDQIGACSVADGAGLLQLNEAAADANVTLSQTLMQDMRRAVGNAMSNSNVQQALSAALRTRAKMMPDYYCYVVDVYPKFFVYEAYGADGTGPVKLWKLGYTIDKTDVTIDEGNPVEVVRVTEYRTADEGKFVGNEARTNKENDMDRKAVIDGLIANEATGFDENDRAMLEKADDATLNKWAKGKEKKKDMPKEDAATTENAGKAAPVANAAPAKVQTAAEYVAAAPAEIRELLNNGLATAEAQKQAAIATITANKANKFSKEFLATKGLAELQGMAALCAEPVENTGPVQMFYGASVPASPTANVSAEEPMLMPAMTFGTK